jgi:hypothetical protein
VALAKRLFPQAQLLIVGPMSPTPAYDQSVSEVDNTLAAAAYYKHLRYVSGHNLGWFSQEKRKGKVNVKIVHPTSAGYAVVGREFARYVSRGAVD